MPDINRHPLAPALLAAALLCGAAPASADVTLREALRVEGTGLMSMMNMSGTSTVQVSGNRARTDSDLQMESRMLRMFGGVGPSAEIVRLDEDRLISLDLQNRTYTETTFTAQRAELEQAMAQMRESQQSQQQGMSGINESDCEWSEATARVERTGARAVIGNYPAEQVKLSATQSCRDRKSDQVCDFSLRVEQWVAPDFEMAAELMTYYQAFAEKMGLDATGSRSFSERAETMFGGYDGIWRALAEHMQTLEGYPVKASMAFAIGGPQCRSTEQLQAATSGTGMPGVGEMLGGALGGRIGGMLGRKRDDSAAAPAATTVPADGMYTLMTITSELLAVERGPVSAAVFEIPAGFSPARR
jgi:hypothetical protein